MADIRISSITSKDCENCKSSMKKNCSESSETDFKECETEKSDEKVPDDSFTGSEIHISDDEKSDEKGVEDGKEKEVSSEKSLN